MPPHWSYILRITLSLYSPLDLLGAALREEEVLEAPRLLPLGLHCRAGAGMVTGQPEAVSASCGAAHSTCLESVARHGCWCCCWFASQPGIMLWAYHHVCSVLQAASLDLPVPF